MNSIIHFLSLQINMHTGNLKGYMPNVKRLLLMEWTVGDIFPFLIRCDFLKSQCGRVPGLLQRREKRLCLLGRVAESP